MKRWYLLYSFLFALYLALELAAFINVPQVPWLKDVNKWSPAVVTALLFILVYRAEAGRGELAASLGALTSARDELASDLRQMVTLKNETAELKSTIEALQRQLRVSDALLQGKLLFYQGQYGDAADLFKGVVAADPENPENRYWLGRSLMRADNPHEAIQHLLMAAERSGNAEHFRTLGEAELRLRRLEEAEVHLSAALTRGIVDREGTMLLLAKVQAQTDRARAKVTLEELVALNPRNGNAVRELSHLLVEEGDYERAVSVCNSALVKNPKNWALYPARAEALFGRNQPGDRQRAEEDLRIARMGNPRDSNIYRVEAKEFTNRALATADAAKREHFLREAVRVHNEALGLPLPPGSKATVYQALAFVYIALGDGARAEEAAKNSVQSNPEDLRNHLALCSALLYNRRWPALQRAARGARDIGGRRGRIYSYLFEILGGLLGGESLSDLCQEVKAFVAALRDMPTFKPGRRDWQFVRPSTAVSALTGKEQQTAQLLVQYLDGDMSNDTLVANLERVMS